VARYVASLTVGLASPTVMLRYQTESAVRKDVNHQHSRTKIGKPSFTYTAKSNLNPAGDESPTRWPTQAIVVVIGQASAS
jgi:hypothetical protein